MCSRPAGRKNPDASHARMSAIFQVHGSSGICVMPPMLSSRENGSSHLRARARLNAPGSGVHIESGLPVTLREAPRCAY